MSDLLRTIGVIIALVLAYTVLGLFAERLPVNVARGIPFLIPLLALLAVWWLSWEHQKTNSGEG